jgi:hypothetical protein
MESIDISVDMPSLTECSPMSSARPLSNTVSWMGLSA